MDALQDLEKDKIRNFTLQIQNKNKFMQNIDHFIRGGVFLRIKQSFLAVFLRIFLNNCLEAWIDAKYMASYDLLRNPSKLKTHIAIKVHALEKGMSIGKTRYGFGKKKAFEVLHDLQHYLSLGGEKEFVNECCSIIERYISFNEAGHADMNDIKSKFIDFRNDNDVSILNYGGILELNHSELQKRQKASFDIFSQGRYSCRDLGSAPIDREDVEKALQLCERTPSACNRQSVRVHVYFDKDKKDRLCQLQGGCKGFSDDFQAAILICEDLTGYSSAETNLPYVDGGLYAMNLLYSLNFYDLAAIPLTMGHREHYNLNLLKKMEIPFNEVPVLLIGVGSYKDKWRVAQSHRKDWHNYTTFN